MQELLNNVVGERDYARAWADKLANAIAECFAVDIGEHSSRHNPWAAAIDVLQTKITRLRAKGVVDADDNLDCWDTAPYEICRRHVAALAESDPLSMWRVVNLCAVEEAPNMRTCTCHPSDDPPTPCEGRYALHECKAEAEARAA